MAHLCPTTCLESAKTVAKMMGNFVDRKRFSSKELHAITAACSSTTSVDAVHCPLLHCFRRSPHETNPDRAPHSCLRCRVRCAATAAQEPSPDTSPANPLAASRVFAYDDMGAKTAANGSVSRRVFTGTLATGEVVGVHESMQPAGTPPNPAHRIQHSEVIVVAGGNARVPPRRQDGTRQRGQHHLRRLRHAAPGEERRRRTGEVRRHPDRRRHAQVAVTVSSEQ